MKSILEELWYGNICPNDEHREITKETKKLMEHIVTHHDNLCRTLTEEQKDSFEKFNNCHSELSCINEREIFVYAFSLGARIAIEFMSFNVE